MNTPAHPTKILWLTENYPPSRGGMAQSCDRIVENIRRSGFQVDVIHFLPGEQHHIKCDDKSNGRYIRCYMGHDSGHALNCLWNTLSQIDGNNAGKGFLNQFSHVVCFGGYYPMKAAPIYAQWLQCPLLVLLRGNDFDIAVFSTKKQPVLLQALDKATAIACISRDMTQKVNRLLNSDKARFIANGIDLDDWRALPGDDRMAKEWRQQHVEEEKIVIGFFGHIKEKKGLRFFIQTLEKSGYAHRLHCLFVGDLDEQDFAYIHEQDKVSFTWLPFKDRFELVQHYLACDVVAIPSFYDGMPNVLLEAGGLGIPVIASNVAGMRDVLVDDEHGFLFAAGDFNQCREAIYRLANSDKDSLVARGKSLLRHIKDNVNDKIENTQYCQLLSDSYPLYASQQVQIPIANNANIESLSITSIYETGTLLCK